MQKKLYRSVTDRKISGVCGGIAEFFGIDSTIVRLIFVCCVIFVGTGLLAYIICALVIPENPVSNPPYTYNDNNPYNGNPNDGNPNNGDYR